MSAEEQAAQRSQIGDPAAFAATAELFDPHLHETFSVDPESAVLNARTRALIDASRAEGDEEKRAGPVELELVEVTRYPQLEELEGGFSHRPREPFALLFRGSHDQPMISALYTVSHPELGDFQLFLSPVQESLKYPVESHPEGRFYESAFN